MLRRLVAVLAALGLLALAACSDDDNGKKPDTYRPPDAGVDTTPPMEAGTDMAPADAGPEATPGEAGVEAGADTGPKYSALVGIAEYTGSPGGDAGPIRLLRGLANVERPDPTIKPDFIDSPTPPNCYGYKWTATTLPNRSAWDAGKLTIKGHKTVVYVDGDNPGTPTPLPATIECTRKQMPGSTTLYYYDCGLPEKTVLPVSSAFESTTTLEIGAAGGTDVPAFSETGVGVAGVPTLKTDLTTLDPGAGIKIEWDPAVPNALLVSVVIRAMLKDGSEFAEITCSQLAVAGDKAIPAGAIALLPTPGATNPLIMQTFVAGLAAQGKGTTWGDYKVGAGQGVFGVTCRLASGLCP
jgi:hypothetical protein